LDGKAHELVKLRIVHKKEAGRGVCGRRTSKRDLKGEGKIPRGKQLGRKRGVGGSEVLPSMSHIPRGNVEIRWIVEWGGRLRDIDGLEKKDNGESAWKLGEKERATLDRK